MTRLYNASEQKNWKYKKGISPAKMLLFSRLSCDPPLLSRAQAKQAKQTRLLGEVNG